MNTIRLITLLFLSHAIALAADMRAIRSASGVLAVVNINDITLVENLNPDRRPNLYYSHVSRRVIRGGVRGGSYAPFETYAQLEEHRNGQMVPLGADATRIVFKVVPPAVPQIQVAKGGHGLIGGDATVMASPAETTDLLVPLATEAVMKQLYPTTP